MPNEILKSIVFTNLEQLIQDVNGNFGILANSLQNSPGADAEPGTQGNQGQRGSSFLFVDLQKFQTAYPSQFASGNDITIEFINVQLQNQVTSQKLMNLFDVTEFVANDIFVLTNSLMCNYVVSGTPKIVSTNLSFNESVTFSTTIDKKVKDEVAYALSINPQLNSLANIFTVYPTLAVNYSDSSNNVDLGVVNTSAYSPKIKNYSKKGTLVPTHNYFGFTDLMLSNSDGLTDPTTGTVVFGSMIRYYQMLQNTLNVDGSQTLTTDYLTGKNNIPNLICLQDTTEAGILFGYKGRDNLKSFASIYKNAQNDVVIESDSGALTSEFSRLLLNSVRLKYEKAVEFGNTLLVSGKTTIGGDISNKSLRSGSFTKNALSPNFNSNVTEVGVYSDNGVDSLTINVANREQYTNYLSNVLVTDSNGFLQKNFSVESGVADGTTLLVTLNANKRFLTSNYYNAIVDNFNSLLSNLTANYYTKANFGDGVAVGVIPNLSLSGKLKVDGNVNFGGLLTTNTITSTTNIGASNFSLGSYQSKVLVTDVAGNVLKTYTLETGLVNGTLLSATNADKRFITSNYYNALVSKIDNLASSVATNYWSKSEMNIGLVTQNIILTNGTTLGTNGEFYVSPSGGTPSITANNNFLNLGRTTTATNFNSVDIYFNKILANTILSLDSNKKLVSKFSVETTQFVGSIDGSNSITTIPTSDVNKLATSAHLNFLGLTLNSITTRIFTLTTSNIPEGDSTRRYFNESRVRNTQIVGFNSVAGNITEADSIILAISKLDGNINNKLNSSLLTQTITTSTTQIPSANAVKVYSDSKVLNNAYDSSWFSVSDKAPSQKSVFNIIDKIVSNATYDSDWGTVEAMDIAPSQYSVYRKMEYIFKYGVPCYSGSINNFDIGTVTQNSVTHNSFKRDDKPFALTAYIDKNLNGSVNINNFLFIRMVGMSGISSTAKYRVEVTINAVGSSLTDFSVGNDTTPFLVRKVDTDGFIICLEENYDTSQLLSLDYAVYELY